MINKLFSKINEDFQSGNTLNTFVTCEELNPVNSSVQNKVSKKDLNISKEYDNLSPEIDENSTNSDEGSSSDSVYQELKSKNVKHTGSDDKDLKKWIKHCREKCPRNWKENGSDDEIEKKI